MKIQSHELTMSSQHLEYKTMIASSMQFENFFVQEEIDGVENLEKLQKAQRDSDKSHTLEGIIQSLIEMIQARRLQSLSQEQERGYTHFSYEESFEEYESMSFTTIGHVTTEKGCIDLNLNVSMSRSFIVENRIDIYTSFDPLVINLKGEVPSLLEETFSFDLDNDGRKDQISVLQKGNGFLALDKNKDGKINQGSELFGTKTGNGFGELSEYDEDENSWIDENDSIFESLQIWLKNKDTNDKELIGLGEVGIGAIYLNNESSKFTYKTAKNETLGEMKSSGIFLKENGLVGNISQIDFVKKEAPKEELLATLLRA